MCRIAVALALVVGCCALVTPASADIKWHQPPGMRYETDWHSWVIAGTAGPQVADDFMCRDGRAITDVHWWGSYSPGPDGNVSGFIIQFWSNVPEGPDEPYSHPGDLLYEVFVDNVPETYYGVTLGGETVYEYDLVLPLPFEQKRGRIYWLSIVAILQDTGQVWGWHESCVQWMDASVTGSYGATWWEPNYNTFKRPADMSFYLTTQGPGNGVKWVQCPDMETGLDFYSQTGKLDQRVADDFMCYDGNPIARLKWWGSYPGPYGRLVPVPEFIIRFYEDVPADPDTNRPSHPGDLLYEESLYELADFTESYLFTTPDGEDVYEYIASLSPQFEQHIDKVYWISIVAVVELPTIWGWHETMENWNDAAVTGVGEKWYPMHDETGAQKDMSFYLWTTSGHLKWSAPPVTDRAADIRSQMTVDTKVHCEVADDFLCEDGMPISDVHWWGSYLHNWRASLKGFWIRFYSDVPWWESETGHSHPGHMLAEYFVRDYNETFYGTDGSGMDVYQYYAKLPDWFEQKRGEVYWLSIVAENTVPPLWGWHDSRFHWNDDAVNRNFVFGPLDWTELFNPYVEKSTDMAFELTSPVRVRAPLDWFNPMWVWFSIPADPIGSSDASMVLGYTADNRVFRWDPVGKNWELYPYDFTNLETGRGYGTFLFLGELYNPSYTGIRPKKWVHLPEEGRSLIGLPDVEDYRQDWASIENLDTGEVRTAWTDYTHTDPWINWNFVYWDSYVDTWQICVMGGGGTTNWMHPWYGYYVWSYERNTRLIFNRPCP